LTSNLARSQTPLASGAGRGLDHARPRRNLTEAQKNDLLGTVIDESERLKPFSSPTCST